MLRKFAGVVGAVAALFVFLAVQLLISPTDALTYTELFIVSELTEGTPAAETQDWQASAVYPGLRMRFVKAPGTRCDRCWKVTPEADGTGLCVRCRKVLSGLEPAAVAAPA